jgi:SNF2 family DNA or RNA helicase
MDPAAHALLQSLLSSGGLLSGDASRLLSASLQGMIPQHSSNASHTMPPQQLVATQIQQQQQALQLQQLRQVLLMEQQRSQAALAALRGGSGPAKAAAAGHVGGAENAAMQQHQHHHHHHHQQQQQQQQQAPIVLTPLAPLELPTWTVPEDPTSDAVLGPVDEAQFALPRPSFERLFGHQRDGVAWMYGLYRERTGGILGDDMGMGKTLQACTLLAGLFHTRRIRRALIVAPVSVVESWHRELQKAFAALPEDQPIVIHAISSSLTKQRRGTLLREVAAFGQDDASSSAAASGRRRAAGRSRAAAAEVQPIGVVVISTYQLVANAVDQFSFGCASGLGGSDEPDDEAASEEGEEAAGPAASADSAPHGNRWDYVILDEGHTIKNPKAKTTIAMEQLPSSQRLLLTGTPIHNNLADLHTLISWCTGGRLLGTKEHFQTNFMRPIEQGADRNATTRVKEFSAHKARELWSVIRPHLLQRSKNTTVEVQRHLPTKIELALWPCLSEVQVSVYNEFLVTKGFASMARDSPFPLEAIAHLRTICRHPLLIEFLRRKQAWARFQSLRRHVASMRNRMGRATEVDLDFLHIGERARSADFDDEDDNADLRDGESADTDEASVNEEFARFSPEDAETELGRQARELLLFTPLLRPAYGASARAKPARRSRRQAASSRSGKSGKSGNESDDDVAGLMQKLSVKDKAPHRGPSRRVVMDSDDDDDSYRANSEGGEGESESESEEDEEGAGAGDDGDAELAEWLADSASPSEVEGIVSAIHSKPFFKTMDTGRLASALGSMLERVGQAPIASRGSSSRERVVSAILQQSHKLKLARELIMAAVDGGHRVLLFSQSRQMLDILEFVLLHASAGSSGVEGRSLLAENVSRLDGSVAGKERQRIMDAFNDGERAEREEGAAGAASQGASAVTRRRARAAAAGASMVMRGPRVCLLTTKACGYGITLTGADRVIVFDPSWNPAEDRQAVDRAFRIGQTRAVVVYRMITAAVIEERIYGKQVFKDAVRCTVLDDHTTTSGHGVTVQSAAQRRAAKTQERNYFSRDEIRKLFVVENFSRSTVLDRLVEIHGENATVTEASMPEIDDSVGAWASGWMHGNAVLGVSRHDKLFAPPPVEAPEATSSSKARASSAAAAAAEAGAASAPAPALGLIPKKKAAVPADVLGAAPTVQLLLQSQLLFQLLQRQRRSPRAV